MPNATDTNPKQVIRQGPRDYDALLHGEHVGSFSSELQAWTELNHVYLQQQQTGTTPETPVSADAEADVLPADTDDHTASLPIPAADLSAAAARLRPDPAITRALKRLLEGGWTYQDADELVLRFDPRSKGRGKKAPSTYTTRHDSCTCPGAIIRGGCYHPVAWQVVNEALVPTTAIQCMLHSATFLPLGLLALSAGTDQVALRADSGPGALTITASDQVTVTVTVEMVTPVLLRIEQSIHAADLKRIIDALAGALPPEGAPLLLDLNAGSLLIIAGTEDAPVFVDGLDTLPLDTQPHLPA